MSKNAVMFLVLGVIAGFVAGFIVANKLNASEIAALRTQSASSGNQQSSPNAGDDTLSPSEIEAKIAEADRNPNNFAFQKSLGVSLYRYGAMKQDAALVERSIRILERADSLQAKDFDVLVALGNAQFDVGFFRKDISMFERARGTYARALGVKPGDADVQTDIGISYFVQEPADYEKAVAELQKVVNSDGTHDRSMQFLVQAYAKLGKTAEAEKVLAKLIDLNPSNPAITELRSAISDAKAGR